MRSGCKVQASVARPRPNQSAQSRAVATASRIAAGKRRHKLVHAGAPPAYVEVASQQRILADIGLQPARTLRIEDKTFVANAQMADFAGAAEPATMQPAGIDDAAANAVLDQDDQSILIVLARLRPVCLGYRDGIGIVFQQDRKIVAKGIAQKLRQIDPVPAKDGGMV